MANRGWFALMVGLATIATCVLTAITLIPNALRWLSGLQEQFAFALQTREPTRTIEAASPSLTPTDPNLDFVATPSLSMFSVEDANNIELNEDCSYLAAVQIIEDTTKVNSFGVRNFNNSVTWDLSFFPDGVIVGDAVRAEIDGHLLGLSGVLFVLDPNKGVDLESLTLLDGVFHVVSPEDVEGFITLRQRYLACHGRPREPVYYPDSFAEISCVSQQGWTPPRAYGEDEWIYDCLLPGSWVGQDEEWKGDNWTKGSGNYEWVNIVIPEGGKVIGIGCGPCIVFPPNGAQKLLECNTTEVCFSLTDPNYRNSVSSGDVYKVQIFGADTCEKREVAPPCSPEIYISINIVDIE